MVKALRYYLAVLKIYDIKAGMAQVDMLLIAKPQCLMGKVACVKTL